MRSGSSRIGRENLLLYGDMIFNAIGPRNELLPAATERVEPVTPGSWITASASTCGPAASAT